MYDCTDRQTPVLKPHDYILWLLNIAATSVQQNLMQGSIGHTTCEYQQLLDTEPDAIIPSRPLTVYERVYDAGDPLGGNFCPFNSSSPLQPCKKVCLQSCCA